MNIIEAFIKYRGQLVILISGMSGCGLTQLCKTMSDDLGLSMIGYNKYCVENYDVKVKLPSGVEMINWDTDEIVEWESFINDINKNKSKGVIAYGQSFPSSKIDNKFTPDVHIHIKISKKNLLKRRQDYNKRHQDECEKIPDQEIDLTLFNNLTYPYYMGTVQNSHITKFINGNDYIDSKDYDKKIADETFAYVTKFIEEWLNEYDRTKKTKTEEKKDTETKKKTSNYKLKDPIYDDENDDEKEESDSELESDE